MPLCVAGMHRSGTSLIANVLHGAGLHLGDEADIMPPGPGNPEGHWENVRFVKLNDAIIELAGGNWFSVPRLEDGWQCDPKFDPLIEQAADLLRGFEGREPWGWKDPRNSLTLPFWRRLVPDLKVLVCVRNPLEVAQSLSARDKFTEPLGLSLWTDYSSRIVAATMPTERLVTHYESCFLDFHAERNRLLRFADLPTTDAAPRADERLRHNRQPLRNLFDGRLSADSVKLYIDLCAEAGPVFLRDFHLELLESIGRSTCAIDATSDRHVRLLGRIAASIVESEHLVRVKNDELKLKDDALNALGDAIMNRDHELDRLRALIQDYHDVVEGERRRGDALQERLRWNRYAWADWVAKWLSRIRPGKSNERT